MKTFTKLPSKPIVGAVDGRDGGTTEPPAVLLPRNYVQGCLLLLLAESSTHGYDLLEQLAELGLPRADSSAVYRALRHLNRDGLVESWWEESTSGPARRCYRITDAGAANLEHWAASVAASSIVFRAFLARHGRLKRVASVAVRRPA